jgi:hypothetical protein
VLTRACIVTRACRQSNGGSQKVSSQKGTAVGSPKVTRVQGHQGPSPGNVESSQKVLPRVCTAGVVHIRRWAVVRIRRWAWLPFDCLQARVAVQTQVTSVGDQRESSQKVFTRVCGAGARAGQIQSLT